MILLQSLLPSIPYPLGTVLVAQNRTVVADELPATTAFAV